MTYHASPDRYEAMQYRSCGRSGLKLPLMSLGLWHNFGDTNTLASQRDMLRTAFDLGITHFDLANNYGPPYGSAETNFGHLYKEDFKPYRDELIISTKAGWDMWPGPYGQGAARVNTCWPASIKACSAWASTTSTSSIRTASTRTRRWKKPWARWRTRSSRARRCTSACPRIRPRRPPRRRACWPSGRCRA